MRRAQVCAAVGAAAAAVMITVVGPVAGSASAAPSLTAPAGSAVEPAGLAPSVEMRGLTLGVFKISGTPILPEDFEPRVSYLCNAGWGLTLCSPAVPTKDDPAPIAESRKDSFADVDCAAGHWFKVVFRPTGGQETVGWVADNAVDLGGDTARTCDPFLDLW